MRRFAAAFQSTDTRFVALLGIVMASAIVFLFAAGAPGSGPCAGYGMCGVLGLGEPFAFGECSLVHAAPNLRTAGFSDDAKTGLPSNASELSSESALVSGSAPASDLSSDPGPARTVRAVEEFLQYPAGLPSGCEPVSIALALRSLGFEIDPAGFIDAYVRLDPTWSDPALFLGSPYDVGSGYPLGMAEAANAYLEDQGSSLRAVDATGMAFGDVVALAEKGSPVAVWTTLQGDPPAFSGDYVGGYAFYTNQHCVLVYGIEDGRLLMSDPIQGLVEVDPEGFGAVYEECGSLAVYFEERG